MRWLITDWLIINLLPGNNSLRIDIIFCTTQKNSMCLMVAMQFQLSPPHGTKQQIDKQMNRWSKSISMKYKKASNYLSHCYSIAWDRITCICQSVSVSVGSLTTAIFIRFRQNFAQWFGAWKVRSGLFGVNIQWSFALFCLFLPP